MDRSGIDSGNIHGHADQSRLALSLGALAVQYVAAFWLVTRHLPFVMGSAKLITGWMVVAALGMTRLGLPTAEDEKEEPFCRADNGSA